MTKPLVDNITLMRGDTPTYGITVEGVNITGWEFYFTAKKKLTDADSAAQIKIDVVTHADPTNGYTEFTLDSNDTDTAGTYQYSIRYKTPTSEIITFMHGLLTIEDHATIRTDNV